MQIIADLQIHSKFSRAVSKEMTLSNIASWASRKGIGLMATGDWMHPMWFREIERDLEETGTGLLKLKSQNSKSKIQINSNNQNSISKKDPQFMLATEVSCIYTQGGKGRRVHTLVWVPSIDAARKINQEMTKRGCNLLSDGRPIIGLTSIDVAELVLTIEPKALIIPAHAWTPWFSLYGSKSGFDSIDDAFGSYAKYIYAIETGLSSSPDMNWRIKELDNRSILSFSDAHSGPKIGREATVFEIPDDKLSYDSIYEAITNSARGDKNFLDPQRASAKKNRDNISKREIRSAKSLSSLTQNNSNPKPSALNPNIAFTIEFHPEEGKYHYSGHRSCNTRLTPDQEVKGGSVCSVCGKPLTQGVMQRVEELAGRSEEDLKLESRIINHKLSESGIKMTFSKSFPNRSPFVMLVPLQEIISEAIKSPVLSNKTQTLYYQLTDKLKSEFNVLLKSSTSEIAGIAGEKVAEGVNRVRAGDIVVDPGYDGVFGVVKIWQNNNKPLVDLSKEQMKIF